jgi:hypothetical protein
MQYNKIAATTERYRRNAAIEQPRPFRCTFLPVMRWAATRRAEQSSQTFTFLGSLELFGTTALPPKADIPCGGWHVCFVPLADIASVVPNDGSGCQLRHSRTTSFILLDRWAWHRPVRAEYAAIARLWFKPLATSLAVIEKLARIGWHLLSRLVPALRTGDCGGFNHGTSLSG